MRLTCPNCGAQYEVPDDVIPENGRDVQCSNCEQTWFQPKNPDDVPEPDQAEPAEASTPTKDTAPEPPEAAASVEPDPAPPPAPSPNVDPNVANILKEEAEREAELRAQEGVGLESQPDFPLEPPESPHVEPKTPKATETATDAGQSDALPDLDTINSGLRSDDINMADAAQAAPRKSGGFLRGFSLIVILGVVLILIYGNASKISQTVPQAEPVLQSYVSLVDQARVWLEAQTGAEN